MIVYDENERFIDFFIVFCKERVGLVLIVDVVNEGMLLLFTDCIGITDIIM